jgi:peptidoglycan/LPS O-acetylase OafA/YrhL
MPNLATEPTAQAQSVETPQALQPVPPKGASAPGPGRKRTARVIQLDFVRGIAILAVMEYHFLTVPVNNIFARSFEQFGKRIGWMGVDLFFVLSGFLVGGLLVQELLKTGEIRIWRFLSRRMFKIWPAYYFYILFQICVRKHPLPTFVWQNLLNIQNYAGTSLMHTWSLAVEEHFYVALPVALLFMYRNSTLRKWMVHILAGCCALVLCGRIVSVYGLHSGDPQWLTHARIDSLLFGVILSYILYAHREAFEKLVRFRVPLLLATLGGIVFGLYNGDATRAMWSFGYTLNYLSLGSLMLLVYGYEGRATRTFLYKAVALIGVYSYGIYLWHLSVREPLAKFMMHVAPGVRWGTLMVSQYAAAIILGVVVTKAIEFPMLRLRERLVPRGPAQLPPDVADSRVADSKPRSDPHHAGTSPASLPANSEFPAVSDS